MSCSWDPPPSRYSCNASPHKETGLFHAPFQFVTQRVVFREVPAFQRIVGDNIDTVAFPATGQQGMQHKHHFAPASGPVQQLKVIGAEPFRACPHWQYSNVVPEALPWIPADIPRSPGPAIVPCAFRWSWRCRTSFPSPASYFHHPWNRSFRRPGRHGRWQMSSGRGSIQSVYLGQCSKSMKNLARMIVYIAQAMILCVHIFRLQPLCNAHRHIHIRLLRQVSPEYPSESYCSCPHQRHHPKRQILCRLSSGLPASCAKREHDGIFLMAPFRHFRAIIKNHGEKRASFLSTLTIM